MKTVFMTLILALTAVTAGAQEMNPLSAAQKFQVMVALRDSTYRGDTEVKPVLDLIGKTDHGAIYKLSKFSCEYIGRSLRYECDLQISAQESGNSTEIYAIGVVGYVEEEMPIQHAEVTDLRKVQP